jgi:methyltransferase-like protein
VAFVSYNVLPGWQLRLALRRWLLQMIDQGRSTAERLRLARSCLLNLSDILSHATDDRRFTQLRAEVTQLEKWSDAYLRHDLLEDFNDPVMFVDFVAHAREYGLKFFAEAEFATMVGNDLPPTVSHRLSQLNCAQIQREQLIDMLTNRTFRQSLLCREAQRPRDRLGPDTVRLLYAVSTLKEISETSSAEATLPTFRSRTGFEVSPGNPVCREALRELAQRWPAGEFVIQLTKSARDRLRTSNSHEVERDFESDVDELCIILLAGFAERSVELHVAKPPFETAPSETPEASPLARAQAEVQNWVSSLRHDLVPLNDKQRLLVRHLDGTRCRPELLQLLTRAPQHLDLEPINEVINSSWIDLQLHWAARRGLLCPTR